MTFVSGAPELALALVVAFCCVLRPIVRKAHRRRRSTLCWKDGPTDQRGVRSSCLRRRGHAGPHRYRSDDLIARRFLEAQL